MSVAALAATALLLVFGSVATAQQPFEVSVDADCNAETGALEVLVTIENFVDDPGDAVGQYSYTTSSGDVGGDSLTFVPAPVPAEGTSSASVSVPGDTTSIDGEVVVDYGDFDFTVGFGFAVDTQCETTTTTTGGGASSSTTSTTAAAAATAQPRFTG
jgi:hypothetical protein